MIKLLDSKFETYLMDQEVELRSIENQNEEQQTVSRYEEYPEGFFTSL